MTTISNQSFTPCALSRSGPGSRPTSCEHGRSGTARCAPCARPVGSGTTQTRTSRDYSSSSALVAVERFDAYALEQTLRTAVLRLPIDDVLDQVIAPLLFTIGSLWHQGQLKPANEHLATMTVRRVLGWISEATAPAQGSPVVLVATPANQMHELGAMLAATTASGDGWRVVYLGANRQPTSSRVRRSDRRSVSWSVVPARTRMAT